ncbi:endonuclease domain-containing protein [Priestia taiwanensis]|uniref:Restriction endonuclease type II-like domain-containing protein n=1 Tax=Priestia taiwanensis TaxID=1347902 RepID=A0A917ANK2_9BACI|nr:DUF559 domain-containing protein [Priestia taiwanensis]MBM7362368.1 very-short-patch-repair endonuclease [Priestia taiwanensis]GGE61619.1 hypothetical protein GCM10007140_09920 [Priestia taiwanensis]
MLNYIVFFGLIAVILIVYTMYGKYDNGEALERLKGNSYIETRLYQSLEQQGYPVRSQTYCGPYRIDLTLYDWLAIECDGKAYHSTPEQKAHDSKKNHYLRSQGWTVLRFTGSKIHNDLPGVLHKIEKTIHERS